MSNKNSLPSRLNFGCGHDKRDGYLNVDTDPHCGPDLVLVGNDLSVLPSNWFEEILALDVLEHIHRVATLPVLVDWSDLLIDGGLLRVETSDVQGVVKRMTDEPSFASHYGWTQCMFGTQAHPGDFHHTGFTETTLTVHVLAAGFEIERLWVEHDWLLNVEARKVFSWSAFADGFGGQSDAQFVDAIYHEILGRPADPEGARYFLTELGANRVSRRDAVRHLMVAPERLYAAASRHGL